MARRLPSLNALRAFEAAARHSSFSKAADELSVTHAAVSRQVRELESWLGSRLFSRRGQGVVPTEAGKRYQQTLTRLFDELLEATESLDQQQNATLTVRVDPSLAALWLVPRLVGFQRLCPEVELVIEPSYELLDSRAERAELAVQYSYDADGDFPDAELLCEVRAFALCSPGYRDEFELRKPEDLLGCTLLHDENRSWWQEWFTEAGVNTDVDQLHGHLFEECSLVFLAAEHGQGVALGDDLLARDALASGRLVKPLEATAHDGGYYLVRRPGNGLSETGAAFCEWLVAQVRDEHAGR